MHRFVLCTCIAILPLVLSAQSGRVEHLKHGDTTIVRTTGNGLWGAPHDAVELKRVGSESKETTFGRISSMAALPNGGVALFDDRSLDGPIAKLLDPNGKFVKIIGRIGSGPGEYREFATITTTPDGRLLISDPLNARANLYATDGRYVSAARFTQGNSVSVDMVRMGLKGNFFVRSQRSGFGPGVPTSQGYVVVDSTGRTVDSIPPHANVLDAPFTNLFLPILPDGRMILLAHDRVAFLVRPPKDIQHPMLVALALEPVKYLPEERTELQAARNNMPGRSGGTADRGSRPPLAEFKQPFTDVLLDGANRIWLHRSVAGVKGAPTTTPMGAVRTWHDPVVFDAFQPDGPFLGEVKFPAGVKILAVNGDIAWGWLTGDDDQIYVVKYRVR